MVIKLRRMDCVRQVERMGQCDRRLGVDERIILKNNINK
jgi:hypothetical protein